MRRLSILVLLLGTASIPAAEVTQFRGPGGAGVSSEKGLPTTWSSTENIVWRTKMPGPGTSSPIVVGERIYLTSYTGYGQGNEDDVPENMDKLRRHLVCVDRGSGKVLFTKDFKPALPESNYKGGNNRQHGYSSSTIASDGRRLYVFFGKSGVYCLDLDGNEVWHAEVGDKATGWGSSNSPVLYKNLVIVNASIESQSLVALDKATGKEVWRTGGIKSAWNTPVLVKAAADKDGQSGTELVLNESKAVIGFEPESGKELWRVGGFGGYVCPSPTAHDGIVYVVRGEALAIRAGGRGDVADSHVLWRKKLNSRVPSPVYHDGRLYWAANQAYCLDAKTGAEIYRDGLDASFYASGLIADGKIYYVSRFDGTLVLDAGPKFQKLAHNKFEDDPSRTNASPIAHDGCLLLRTDRYLYCIGKK